jgi:hypothetical protein
MPSGGIKINSRKKKKKEKKKEEKVSFSTDQN